MGGVLDDSSGWTAELSRCHLTPKCLRFYQSFHASPSVQLELQSKKLAVHHYLNGQSYTCFHLNTFWCSTSITANGKPFVQKTWDECVKKEMRAVLQNVACDASFSLNHLLENILIVGQSDAQMVPLMKQILKEFHIKAELGDVVFSVADLGDKDFGSSGGLDKQLENQLKDHYIHRGAVAWGLCSSAFARTYIGEFYSGFTKHLVVDALAKPHGQWSALVYGSFHGIYPWQDWISKFAKSLGGLPSWMLSPKPCR